MSLPTGMLFKIIKKKCEHDIIIKYNTESFLLLDISRLGKIYSLVIYFTFRSRIFFTIYLFSVKCFDPKK